MRILVLSLYFPPAVNSTGALMELLCQGLRGRGHDLTIVTTFPHGADAPVRERGWWPWFAREGKPGWRVWRFRVPAFGKKESFVTRTFTYLAYNLSSLVAGLLSGRQDVVLTASPSLTNGVVSWLLGRWKRIPAVYNVQDLVPEAYVQFGVLKSRRVIRLFEALEAFVYRKNSCLTVISQSFAENVQRKGAARGKLAVIPNFVDVDEIAPRPRDNALSRQWGLVGRFVVMHAGSIAYRHGVEVLVEVAGLLADEPDILFLVVGDGSKRHVVEARAKEANLPNFRMMPYVDREQLPDLRACADVQMIVLRRGMTSHSVPCKVYEIMASGRPFVAALDEGSTIWELVKSVQCGLAVPPESAKAIAGAVRDLYYNPERARRLGESGRNEAVARYSSRAIAAQYEELFERLTAGDSGPRRQLGRAHQPAHR